MKVWGITLDGRSRTIIAAPNARQAAEALGVSLYFLRGYGSLTGNVKEIEDAMAKPLIPITKPNLTPHQ